MPEITERCDTCRALLDEEDLFCPNCGTEAPFHGNASREPGMLMATHQFECSGCGASMSYDASAQTLRCPFCGSERLQELADAKTWGPQRIVPFVLDQAKAIQILRKWLGQGFWRPGDLSQAALVSKVASVFVPYWVFSAQTFAYWTADSSQAPPGSRGNWYPLTGEHQAAHHGLLIGASGALTPAETSAICPFDLDQSVPREEVDLENAIFEPFRVQRKYARPLAQAGFESQVRQACTDYVPGRCRNLKVNVRIDSLTSEGIMLPVWIMAYRYRDQVFRFLINGQTGTATGDAPTSWRKIGLALGIAVLCVGLLVLVTWLLSN